MRVLLATNMMVMKGHLEGTPLRCGCREDHLTLWAAYLPSHSATLSFFSLVAWMNMQVWSDKQTSLNGRLMQPMACMRYGLREVWPARFSCLIKPVHLGLFGHVPGITSITH